MKKQKRYVALSILLFGAYIAGATSAYAQQVPSQTAQAQPSANDNLLTRQQAMEPSSPPNTEADAPVSNQAKSKGFVEDSHLNLLFRSFAEHDTFNTVKKKDAWVFGAQAVFESGYTKGLIGFGGALSMFGALKLNGGRSSDPGSSNNQVHVATNGGGYNQLAWAYLGV